MARYEYDDIVCEGDVCFVMSSSSIIAVRGGIGLPGCPSTLRQNSGSRELKRHVLSAEKRKSIAGVGTNAKEKCDNVGSGRGEPLSVSLPRLTHRKPQTEELDHFADRS